MVGAFEERPGRWRWRASGSCRTLCLRRRRCTWTTSPRMPEARAPRPRRGAARLVRGGGPPARLRTSCTWIPAVDPGAPGRPPALLQQAAPDRQLSLRAALSGAAGSPAAPGALVASWPCPPPRQPFATRPSSSATSRPAPGSCRSPAGRCRCSTRASARSTWRCARARGCSTSRTWARSRPAAPGGGPAPAPALERRDGDRRARGPVLGALPRRRRRARRPLHLPARARALPDGHQRREPREGPGLVPRARRRASTPRWWTPTPTGRCSPCRARRRAPRWRRWRTARCRPGCARPSCRWPGVDCLVCGTGYTGEDGAELLMPPDGAGPVWDALAERGRDARGAGRARHAAARGLLPPLRQRPLRGPQPDRGRPRLVLQARHGLHRAGRAARPRARARRSCRSPSPARGSRARATPSAPRRARGWSRAVRSRPVWRRGSGWHTCPWRPPHPGTAIEVDVRGTPRAAEVAEKPLYRKAP